MITQVYYFGLLDKIYSQYPTDYTRKHFDYFLQLSKREAQIVVRREDNLLFYGYVRRFSTGNVLGICIAVDRIFLDTAWLFKVCDDTVEQLVSDGVVFGINANGVIEAKTNQFSTEKESLDFTANAIISRLEKPQGRSIPLPPQNYAISITDLAQYSLEGGSDVIVDGLKNYSNALIVKTKTELERLTSVAAQMRKLSEKNDNLQKENTILKIKNRNFVWVGVLSLVVVVMFMVLYFEVINPSEVTHYETGEFVYYGPLKDKKPHGVGVAIYPSNDKDGRKYYIGNFVNGKRQDMNAMLIYKDGDYYYGSMNDDNWGDGMFYMDSDDSYFRGVFKNNQPYNGIWYEHKKRYELINGEKQY